MHHLNSNHYTDPDSSRYHPRYHPDPPLSHVVASASSVLDQPPPPSLRDILGAYKANGDGDRDMLLAMLNAKTAEDQRLASLAALHRTMLEVYQSPPLLPLNGGGHHHYPTPNLHTRLHFERPGREHEVYHHHHVSSLSRSPPHTRVPLPYMRPCEPATATATTGTQPRRKRVRASRSPPPPPPLPRRRDSVPCA
ncbi:hypothetical protein C8R46DRAFT_200288 [Mycena filopes]|nr:hypothetical protein C8R46DRAFT_200288 [Mycena filopes]